MRIFIKWIKHDKIIQYIVLYYYNKYDVDLAGNEKSIYNYGRLKGNYFFFKLVKIFEMYILRKENNVLSYVL